MLDEWNLENYQDFLLIPVKSSTTNSNPEFFGFMILSFDLNLLFQDVSEYKGTHKALHVARQWVDLHLARMEAL